MKRSLEKSIPWLILAGSGSAADLISEVLSCLSDVIHNPTTLTSEGATPEALSADSREMVREKVRKYFPTEAKVEELVEHVSLSFWVVSLTPFIYYCFNCQSKTNATITPNATDLSNSGLPALF